MAKIAVQEEIDSMRHQEAIEDPATPGEGIEQTHKKYIASIKEAFEAFESIHTLRFSQPTHLQGNQILGF